MSSHGLHNVAVTNLQFLPAELLYAICSRLPWHDLLQAAATCRSLRNVALNQPNLHTLRLPASALPGPDTLASILTQLRCLTIIGICERTTHGHAAVSHTEDHAHHLEAWLENINRYTQLEALNDPLEPSSASPSSRPKLQGFQLRNLALHLDVCPKCAWGLLRLCSNLATFTCGCLAAGQQCHHNNQHHNRRRHSHSDTRLTETQTRQQTRTQHQQAQQPQKQKPLGHGGHHDIGDDGSGDAHAGGRCPDTSGTTGDYSAVPFEAAAAKVSRGSRHSEDGGVGRGGDGDSMGAQGGPAFPPQSAGLGDDGQQKQWQCGEGEGNKGGGQREGGDGGPHRIGGSEQHMACGPAVAGGRDPREGEGHVGIVAGGKDEAHRNEEGESDGEVGSQHGSEDEEDADAHEEEQEEEGMEGQGDEEEEEAEEAEVEEEQGSQEATQSFCSDDDQQDHYEGHCNEQEEQAHVEELFRRLAGLEGLSLGCPHCLAAFLAHARSTALPLPRLSRLTARCHPNEGRPHGDSGYDYEKMVVPAAYQSMRNLASARTAQGIVLAHIRSLATSPSGLPAGWAPMGATPQGPQAAATAAIRTHVRHPPQPSLPATHNYDNTAGPQFSPDPVTTRLPLRPSPPLARPMLCIHTLSLYGIQMSASAARATLSPLQSLRCLSLSAVSVSPTHPGGWAWLGDCSGLTRLALFPGCYLTPQCLGLAHPALGRLVALQELDAPTWTFPREAPANLAGLTALTALTAGDASSLPYQVPTPLPGVRVFRCGSFFGGTPLGGHLAALLPGMTELSSVAMSDMGMYDGEEGMLAAGARRHRGVPNRLYGTNGVGIASVVPILGGWRGRAGPSMAAYHGPTASSARSRVVVAKMPLDVHTVVRLHTYGSLRRLSLLGGPAGALLELAAPLRGLTSLTLRWASLPDSDDEDDGSSSDDEDEDASGGCGSGGGWGPGLSCVRQGTVCQAVLAGRPSCPPVKLPVLGEGGSDRHGSSTVTDLGPRAACSNTSSDGCEGGEVDTRAQMHAPDALPSSHKHETQDADDSGDGSRDAATAAAVSWAQRLAPLVPGLKELCLEHVEGLNGGRGHCVLEALVGRLCGLRVLKLEGVVDVDPQRLGWLVAPRSAGSSVGSGEVKGVGKEEAAYDGGGRVGGCGEVGVGGCRYSCGGGVERLVLVGCSGATYAQCQEMVMASARNVWVELSWVP